MKTNRILIEILEARIAPATFRWALTGSGSWNNSANWFNETTGLANNGFPNAVDDVAKLTNAISANATVTINAVSITVGTLIFDDNNSYVISTTGGGSLNLNGTAGASIQLTTVNGGGAHTISGTLNLGSALTVDTATGASLALNATMSDGGNARNFFKTGTGTVNLNPSGTNAIGGALTASAGLLSLNNAGATFGGPIFVGGSGVAASVISNGANILPDTAAVTVNSQGTYSFLGSDTIGALTVNDGSVFLSNGSPTLTVSSLTMVGGLVDLGAAGRTLALNGNLTAEPSAASSAQIINGSLSIGSVRTFTVNTGPAAPSLTITSAIIGTGGITKEGGGALQFAGASANTYTGTTTVNAGQLSLAKTGGVIAIPGFLNVGDGSGGEDADIVRLFAPNQIANTTVTVGSSGLLDLNGNSDSILNLTINGGRTTTGPASADLTVSNTLTLNGGHLQLQAVGSRLLPATNIVVTSGGFGGSVIDGLGTIEPLGSGTAFNVQQTPDDVDLLLAAPFAGLTKGLIKNGTGTMEVSAVNTHGGGTTVSVGVLRVTGSIGSVTVQTGANLTGSGSVGSITIATASISPDSLAAGSITAGSNSTFNFELGGTAPGDGPGFYDQIQASGTVTLGNAFLSVTTPTRFGFGQTFTLIDNDGTDPVTGTFNNIAEGANVTLGSQVFVISYAGGDGNDVVLSAVAPLVIDGSLPSPGQNNSLTIRMKASDPATLQYFFSGGTPKEAPVELIENIIFLGGSGLDSVVYDLSNGIIPVPLTFEGGGGSDSLFLFDLANVVQTTSFELTRTQETSEIFANGATLSSLIRATGVESFVDFTTPTSSNVSWLMGAEAVVDVRFSNTPGLRVGDSPEISWGTGLPLLELSGATSRNTFKVDFTGGTSGPSTLDINGSGGDDVLQIIGSTIADTFAISSTQVAVTSVPNFGARPVITYSDLAEIELLGGQGADTFAVASLAPQTTLRVNGGAGSDMLSFATSSAAVGFHADLLHQPQTLNGLEWSMALADTIEGFTGSNFGDQITIAPSVSPRSVSDPNGTGSLILDGLGSALTIAGGLLNNANGSVTVSGLEDPTLIYSNIGSVRTIRTPFVPPPAFGASGNAFAEAVDFEAGIGGINVASGDLNGDGRADFVTANAKTGTYSVALSAPAGLLSETFHSPSGGLKPTSVALQDFNGDVFPDIAVTNAGSGTIAIFINNGSGNFSTPTTFPVGKTPGLVRAGDIDGDGNADLAAFVSGNKLAILLGNGDGTFDAPTSLPTGSTAPKDLAIVDLEADGDSDLAILHSGGQLATRVNDGTGAFSSPVIFRAGAGATALAIADFNGDGKLDAAVTHNSLSRFVSVLLGKGDGSFLPQLRITYPTAVKAAAIVATDFDGDGKTDLAIANGVGGRVSILRGLGAGTFAKALELILDDTPPRKLASLVLGDVDGDGRLDLLALSSGTGDVSVVTRA